MKNVKPLVGVSQCLLGDAVRYDGQSKANRTVLENFDGIFSFIAICPEVEAGLSIPRPPVQLTGSIDNLKLTGRDDSSIDVTDIMQRYCDTKPSELYQLSGFIFKARSPSCGLNSTPVFIGDACVTNKGRGVFASAMCIAYPNLPAVEETELETTTFRDSFIQSVLIFHATEQASSVSYKL